jgi:hypothetical protein
MGEFLPPSLLRQSGAAHRRIKRKAGAFLEGKSPKGRAPMKAIVSMIVAVSFAYAFSGPALAAGKTIHCGTSKDCPSNMQCSTKGCAPALMRRKKAITIDRPIPGFEGESRAVAIA